jgi:hypothetical protein
MVLTDDTLCVLESNHDDPSVREDNIISGHLCVTNVVKRHFHFISFPIADRTGQNLQLVAVRGVSVSFSSQLKFVQTPPLKQAV